MKQKDILMILIPTFIVTLLWVTFTVYHNLTTSTIKSPLDFQIIPIANSFDMDTINQIKRRNQISPEYNSIEAPDPSISPSPSPAPTQAIEEDEFIEEEIINEEEVTPTPTQAIEEDEFIEEDFIEE